MEYKTVTLYLRPAVESVDTVRASFLKVDSIPRLGYENNGYKLTEIVSLDDAVDEADCTENGKRYAFFELGWTSLFPNCRKSYVCCPVDEIMDMLYEAEEEDEEMME